MIRCRYCWMVSNILHIRRPVRGFLGECVNINLVPSDSRVISALFPPPRFQGWLPGFHPRVSNLGLRTFDTVTVQFLFDLDLVSLLWTLPRVPRRNDLLRRLHPSIADRSRRSNPEISSGRSRTTRLFNLSADFPNPFWHVFKADISVRPAVCLQFLCQCRTVDISGRHT